MPEIRRALISVTDKTGVVEFARALDRKGVEILSTGGTARLLREHKVRVTDVSAYTGFPEMLDGRVKTLHPKIHAGILALRDQEEHRKQMEARELSYIDLVAVNLYRFEEAVARPDCTLEEAVEQIDIGGPTLLRASAKNHRFVTVVADPADYPGVLKEIEEGGSTTPATRFELARKVFRLTRAYDDAVSRYLERQTVEGGVR